MSKDVGHSGAKSLAQDSIIRMLKADYYRLLADAREMQKALAGAEDRDLDWDLIHTQNSKEKLQVWRGQCMDALEAFQIKYGR